MACSKLHLYCLKHAILNPWRFSKIVGAVLICVFVGTFICMNLRQLNRSGYTASEAAQEKSEQHHVIFIKVHKAASSTVQNLMLRFSLARDLNVLLPIDPKDHVNEYGSQINPARVLPRPTGGHFDILCDHVIFNETVLAPYFPEDTARIAIVRDPLQQALSALNYFSHVFKKDDIMAGLAKFEGAPLEGFLGHPEQFYDGSAGVANTYINNRMSVDLGFDLNDFEASKKNQTKIRAFLDDLEKKFELILITEFFDESIVLLRRVLNWSMKDIMYLEVNTAKSNQAGYKKSELNQRPSFNSSTILSFRRWAAIDYALYDHFLTIFLNKIKSESFFQEEVNAFREARDLIAKFCVQALRFPNAGNGFTTIAKTDWSESFTVSESDCHLMTMHERDLLALAIKRQKERGSVPHKATDAISQIDLNASRDSKVDSVR